MSRIALLLLVLATACGDDAGPESGDTSRGSETAASKPFSIPSAKHTPDPVALPEESPKPAPVWAAPSASASGRPSALLLGIDGADWDVMDPLIESGYLPNLARLVGEGARADLDCAPAMPETACFCPPVWVSIVSGVPYTRHQIPTIHHESSDRRAAALWEVLHAHGGSSTLVSFRNTWPPEESARYVLTEYGLDWAASEMYERVPREKPELRMLIPQTRVKPEDLFEQLGLPETPEGAKPTVWKSVGRDRVAMQALLRLAPRERTDLTVVLIHSPDKAQHLGWRAVQPTPGAAVDRTAVLRQAKAWRGPVSSKGGLPGTNVVSQYLETDVWLGELLARVAYDYILIASDHGMARNPGKGLPGAHGLDLPEAHQGVFVFWGPGVRGGASLEDVDIFDVAPTLAHALALPVAEDQPGRVLGFTDAWRAAHPIQRVPSWEALRQ